MVSSLRMGIITACLRRCGFRTPSMSTKIWKKTVKINAPTNRPEKADAPKLGVVSVKGNKIKSRKFVSVPRLLRALASG